MTFRMHDDSSPFVRPFAIEGKQPDYQRPRDRHRDHGLVLLHPQNDLSARVAVLTQLMRTTRFRKRKDPVEHNLDIARVDQRGDFG